MLLQTQDDAVARHYLQQLLDNLAVPAGGAPPAVPGSAAAGVTHPVPAPAAGGAPHPDPGSVAGASPEGSSQEGLSHAHPGPAPSAGAAPHPGPGPVVGGSPGGSSPSSAHPGPAPTEVGAPHPAPGPVAGGFREDPLRQGRDAGAVDVSGCRCCNSEFTAIMEYLSANYS